MRLVGRHLEFWLKIMHSCVSNAKNDGSQTNVQNLRDSGKGLRIRFLFRQIPRFPQYYNVLVFKLYFSTWGGSLSFIYLDNYNRRAITKIDK